MYSCSSGSCFSKPGSGCSCDACQPMKAVIRVRMTSVHGRVPNTNGSVAFRNARENPLSTSFTELVFFYGLGGRLPCGALTRERAELDDGVVGGTQQPGMD